MTAANRGDELPQGDAAKMGRTKEDIVSSGQQVNITPPAPVSRFPRIVVQKIHRLHGSSPLKAFASVLVGDILISSCRVFHRPGKEPQFAFPQAQGKNGDWYPIVDCLDQNLAHEIGRKVLNKYDQERYGHTQRVS